MSRVTRKLVFGPPPDPDKNRAVQPQKMAKGLKFQIKEEEDCTIYVAKPKALISCTGTVQLICAFVFAYTKGFLVTQHDSCS